MTNKLHETARALVSQGKGILAADESSGTIKKRFDSIGAESTEDNRRAYREMLFTTAGAESHISGVILFDETLRQSASDGTPFSKMLESQGGHPRYQGRHRRQAPAVRRRGDRHRGPGRSSRAHRGVRRARSPICQVAGRHHHR